MNNWEDSYLGSGREGGGGLAVWLQASLSVMLQGA